MSKSLKNLFISMEEEGNDINQTTLEVSADNTMEEEVAEVTEAGIEVIEAEDDVEELHEIAEGLESIVASLESAVEEGGLDPQAAVFMQHAVAGYTNRLGLEAETIVPSLESFGGASGKAAATTISLEGIKETVQKIWQAIKNAVAKAITAMKNFFAKIFGGVKKLKERHASLVKKVDALDGKRASGKIKVPAPNQLRYSGKVDGASVAKGLKNTAEMGETVYKDLVDNAKTFYANAAQGVANAEGIKGTEDNRLETALTAWSTGYIRVAEKITSYGKPMAGDAAFRKETSKNKTTDDEITKAPVLEKNVIGKSVDEGTEVDVPSAGDLKSMLDSMAKIISLMESRKSKIDELNAARDKAKTDSEKLVKAVSGGKLGEAFTGAKVSMVLRFANKDMTKPISSFTSYSFGVVRAGLAFVDRAVNEYR